MSDIDLTQLQVCFILIYALNNNLNVMHHTIYTNRKSALKTSIALYDLACLKALVIDLSTTDVAYQGFKISA